MSNRNGQLPRGWELRALPDIAQINPPLDRCVVSDDVEIDFVPMRAVDPEGGGLSRPEVSTYGRMKKGYTPFLAGDVITAKITPCMENGKTCVVPRLAGVACFGSTEFHVIRAESGIDARWISNFLLQHSTRHLAQRQMMGGVGQMRVPTGFLESLKIPIPPSHEQERSLEKLDELLSDLDAGLAALERVRAKLKHYRAAVLKAAVEGTLTAEWRAHHPVIEPACELLTRILAERRRLWEEAQLQKFKDAGKEPPKDWKAKYNMPVAPDTSELSRLPNGWCWASIDQLSILVTDGDHNPPKRINDGVPHLTAKNVNSGRLHLKECTFISAADAEKVFRRYQPEVNDLIVTCVGTVGRTAIVPDSFAFSPDRNLAAIRCSRIGPMIQFLQVALDSPQAQHKIATASGSTAQPHLYLGDLRQLIVPLSPLSEQEAIVDAVEDQFSMIDHLETDLDAKLNNAEALRQSILKHAFEGKLVPQDPTDEPASELLKRIAVEREERARQQVAARKTKAKPKSARKKAARS
jgi:type I restriction enzyme, S subunit